MSGICILNNTTILPLYEHLFFCENKGHYIPDAPGVPGGPIGPAGPGGPIVPLIPGLPGKRPYFLLNMCSKQMNVEREMHYSGAKVDIIYIQIKMLLFYFIQRYSNASSIFKHFLKNQQLDNIIATVKSPVVSNSNITT